MSKNRKKSSSPGRVAVGILLGLVCLTLLVKTLLYGHNIALFNPKGMIAQEQLKLMLMTTGILLVIAIPALALLFFIAWKYRESNTKAVHEPNARHGKFLNASIWVVPGIFALVLAAIMWPAAHRLAPQKSIAHDTKPLTIQVVSLRWKWLFIYPEQHIATVNNLQIPVNRPIQFDLTADDAPMSSFWIPNLGGMLYTMTGHSNRLNLMADTVGDYRGRSGEINGAGFADMQFTARVSSNDSFNQWLQDVRSYGGTLDSTEYAKLVEPSEKNPEAFYSLAQNDLYATVLMKYMGNMGTHANQSHAGSIEHGAHHE